MIVQLHTFSFVLYFDVLAHS